MGEGQRPKTKHHRKASGRTAVINKVPIRQPGGQC